MYKHFIVAALALVASLTNWAEDAVLTPAPEGTFTVAVIPDTQRYLGPGTAREEEADTVSNPAFESRTGWLAENLEWQRIVFVSHMGDIVDRLDDRQWRVARACMDRIHGRVPYGICAGNHDMERESGDTSMFQAYFGAERYEGEPWYGGTYAGRPGHAPAVSGNNANSLQLFSAGGIDFVFVHVECNAPDDVLAWVDGVLEEHRGRIAIVTTHMYLGGIPRKGADVPQGRMTWKKVHGDHGNTPQQLWEKCFSKHPNLLIVLCGDQSASITHHQTSIGEHGNTVYEILTDYPRTADDSDWLRLLRFDPAREIVQVWTYSPSQDRLCDGLAHVPDWDDHQFELDISDAISRTVAAGNDRGAISSQGQ